jgi:endonuclease YncB( thermonuclease family)
MLAIAAPSQSEDNSHLQRYLQRQLDTANVRLRFDRRRDGLDGTTLAWVFSGVRLMNAEVVRDGLVSADIHSSDSASLRRQVVQAEKEARQAKRGVWIAIPSGNSLRDP